MPILQVVAEVAGLSAAQRAHGVEVVGPWGSGKVLVAAQVAEALGASLLYITHGRIEAEAAHEDLATFTDPARCVLLPAWEVLPTDAMRPSDDIVAERMNTLNTMIRAEERGEPLMVSVSVRSFLQRVVNRKHLVQDRIDLKVGEEHDLEGIVQQLSKMGYDRELMVEQRGQMSVRGGIFDVFPISGELPYRIEFFGDEIESIRMFEPETQRSVERVEEVQILPRSEKDLLAEQADRPGELSTVADYFGKKIVVAIDEPMAVRSEVERIEEQFADTPYMSTWDEAFGRLGKCTRLDLAQVAHAQAEGATRFRAPMLSMTGWSGKTEGFWEQLEEWGVAGYSVQLYCNNTGERRRLVELLDERGYKPGEETDFDLRVGIGTLREGFSSEQDKMAALSEREMFGRKYVRRVRRRFQAGTSITAFSDVKPGDYIVHIEHGIGRYLGLRKFEGKKNEFMTIQYAGGDIVYVPVTHVDHVQKYVGGGGAVPKVDKIGGATWRRTKAKVKKAVQEMTEELLKLYAMREAHSGHAFGADTHWQDEFEDAFEYEETPDQLQAAAEIKRDMESVKPMERLLCGDVGYGKTEVALRAAFKAVMDKRQVAVLVPTTVLAEQHFQTFTKRFADYPIRVEMLSRFRTPKQQREIVRALREGEVDIVVGTHRLTSGDIQFKALGLVILDEEQRFGVKQKEKMKKLKTNVDVLTLTATPIPRTLHMSMSGVRDMSVINTAPNDRLPIHTCIEVFDEKLVTEAIRRELAREGQVFYLHNRVQSIDKVAAMVKKFVPEARVSIGHGQMPERELEEVMAAFVRGESDVLVCTTIIGSGLDIPNANTIIVDRADQFGLAELYQLRGRVGRYKHRAFAYLLVPGDKALSEDAQKRLKALEEFSTLGSGFRVAMRDLEIRGAGNLLGARQSGHIASVGYEAYNQLIAETVAELKGEPVVTTSLPPFDVAVDASIPDSYIELESQKITLYKRITGIKTVDDVDEMYEELRDRFGEPPRPVRRLLEVMRVRALGAKAGARKIYVRNGKLTIEFDKSRLLEDGFRARLKETFGDRVQFGMNETTSVMLKLEEGQEPVERANHLLSVLTK
ncbi:MAG: transcription-repair coupling factor [Candidatus Hydrogenedentes bacterium]|nr:transcription-repair coupling factor [Candidatus Hydrogenedentota bacterium]